MKNVRFFLPVIALMAAFSMAFAMSPPDPMTGHYPSGGGCASGPVTTPSDGQCPGGQNICKVGTEPAYSNCTFVAANELRYN